MVYKYVAVFFIFFFCKWPAENQAATIWFVKNKIWHIFIQCIKVCLSQNELFHYYYYDSLNLQLHVIFEKKKKYAWLYKL